MTNKHIYLSNLPPFPPKPVPRIHPCILTCLLIRPHLRFINPTSSTTRIGLTKWRPYQSFFSRMSCQLWKLVHTKKGIANLPSYFGSDSSRLADINGDGPMWVMRRYCVYEYLRVLSATKAIKYTSSPSRRKEMPRGWLAILRKGGCRPWAWGKSIV